jgi:hypothetical protein
MRPSRGVSDFREVFERDRNLFYLLAPLAVLLAAVIVFESSVAGREIFIEYIKGLFEPGSRYMAPLTTTGEIRARFLWLASSMALLTSSIAAITVACVVITRCLSGARRRTGFYSAVALTIIALASVQFLAVSLRTLNFDLTLELLASTRIFHPGFVEANVRFIAYAVVLTSIIAAMFLVVAASSTVVITTGNDIAGLNAVGLHISRLRNVLYVGAIMLVCGIVNMGAWMRWPAALLKNPDQVEAFTGMALGVTTYWGAAFTVITIAAYVPPALYLRSQALSLHERQYPEVGAAEREKWLRSEGFTISEGAKPAPIIAMAGPLLAGPLSSILNILSAQLTQ